MPVMWLSGSYSPVVAPAPIPHTRIIMAFPTLSSHDVLHHVEVFTWSGVWMSRLLVHFEHHPVENQFSAQLMGGMMLRWAAKEKAYGVDPNWTLYQHMHLSCSSRNSAELVLEVQLLHKWLWTMERIPGDVRREKTLIGRHEKRMLPVQKIIEEVIFHKVKSGWKSVKVGDICLPPPTLTTLLKQFARVRALAQLYGVAIQQAVQSSNNCRGFLRYMFELCSYIVDERRNFRTFSEFKHGEDVCTVCTLDNPLIISWSTHSQLYGASLLRYFFQCHREHVSPTDVQVITCIRCCTADHPVAWASARSVSIHPCRVPECSSFDCHE